MIHKFKCVCILRKTIPAMGHLKERGYIRVEMAPEVDQPEAHSLTFCTEEVNAVYYVVGKEYEIDLPGPENP